MDSRTSSTDRVLAHLDPETAARVHSALEALPGMTGGQPPTVQEVREYLFGRLTQVSLAPVERHEVVWAMADVFAELGRADLVELCRDPATHLRLAEPTTTDPLAPTPRRGDAVQAWGRTLHVGAPAFWAEAGEVLAAEPVVPHRVELTLAPARALLDAVGSGLTLTASGYLPPDVALALDTWFGWSDEYPVVRPRGESKVPPLVFLREHLTAQRLLRCEGRRLTAPGAGIDDASLWRTLVAPRPRWSTGFEHDVLAATALTLLRPGELTHDQLRDEVGYLLSRKWRGTGGRGLDEGIKSTELAWYRVGLTLDWWSREGGPWSSRVQLSRFGRAAAAALFWSVTDTHPRQD